MKATHRLDYFERLCAQAAQCCPQRLALNRGGVRFLFHYSSPEFTESLLSAIHHWSTQPQQPCELEAVIYLWEGRSSGQSPPAPPAEWFEPAARGEVLGWTEPPVLACQNPQFGLASLWNQESAVGIFWCKDHRSLPAYERASPLRPLFHWIFARVSGQLCHGAVVGKNGRGLMLIGKGGSGKSTTSLLCLSRGWQYCGDDYVLVQGERAISLYGTAKLVERACPRFQAMAHRQERARDGTGKGKVVIWLDSSRITPELSLQCLVVASVSPQGTTSLESCSEAVALQALAPTTMLQLPAAGQASWKRLGRIVSGRPCYRLWLGQQPEEILRQLDALVD